MRTKGLEYFPHYRRSVFLNLIIMRYGSKGYLVVDTLLEKIFLGQEGYYLSFNEAVSEVISRTDLFGLVRASFVAEIVKFCVSENFFDKELYKKYGILTSTEIQKFYIEVKSKSKNFEIVNDYLTYSIRNQLFEKQQKNADKTEQRKQEEMKEDQSEGKEREETADFSHAQQIFKKQFPSHEQTGDLKENQDINLLVTKINDSDFLSSATNLSLKWFSENYDKVIAGSYDNFTKPCSKTTNLPAKIDSFTDFVRVE